MTRSWAAEWSRSIADCARSGSAIWGEHLGGFSVRRDERGGAAVAFHDELVNLGGVDVVHGFQGEVIEDEQLHAQQLSDFEVVAVVEP